MGNELKGRRLMVRVSDSLDEFYRDYVQARQDTDNPGFTMSDAIVEALVHYRGKLRIELPSLRSE